MQKTPNAIALVYEEKSLTYKELDQKSTILAKYLQEKGIKPDSYIGICTERSLEMVIGLLGILKSGAAYVPLDPSYPVERLEYMIKDSQISIILTNSEIANNFSDTWGAGIGGYSQSHSFGPYTLEPCDIIHIVLAEAVAGLCREKSIEVGNNWYLENTPYNFPDSLPELPD